MSYYDDKQKRIDESLAKQLERSIKRNCTVWNAAIEAAATRAHQTSYNARDDSYDTFTVKEIRKLLK